MKKILVLILALIMMLSLTACGSEKIEITTDNWQDYLELKYVSVLEKRVDAFGDVTEEMPMNYTILCLKEEYSDKNVSDETEIALKYNGVEKYYQYTVVDGKLVKGAVAKNYNPMNVGETIGHADYLAFTRETEEMLDTEYKMVVQFRSSGYKDVISFLEDLEIERIEGTLVLE